MTNSKNLCATEVTTSGLNETRSPLSETLRGLEETVTLLEENFSNLVARLQPVLCEPLPSEGACSENEEGLCQLGRMIRSVEHRIDTVNRHIVDIGERCQV